MTNAYPGLPTEPGRVRLTTDESQSDPPPPLWKQMDALCRQQLAQRIAELIGRIRPPIPEMEASGHAPS
jgi:hypothetical protein